MEVMGNNYMPGDPRLVEQLVYELKSQGIFDQFRRECIADVDTKPAYQNLRQRVEGSVTSFLKQQTWRPDMVKNQLREQLRKNIHESGYLETGVERIVDQVVNPKINTVILPKVEDVVYRFLGIEKPLRDSIKTELSVGISDLLPKDLEAVSPDSVHSFKYEEKMRDKENFNDSLNSNSKADDDESPPFEPLIESNVKLESIPLEDNSVDSHLSGFSGLQSHDSNHCSDAKIFQGELLNLDSQASLNDSEGRLSIIISDETTKMDICEDSLSHQEKSEASESKSDVMDVDKSGENAEGINEKTSNNGDKKDEDLNFNEKKGMEEIKRDDKNSRNSDKHYSKDKRDDKHTKSNNNRDKSKSKDDISSSRDKHKKDSKSSSSSIKEKYSKDKNKEKSSKSDKYSKETSSKNKSRDTVDKAKGDKIKEKSDKSSKDEEKDKPDKTHNKEKLEKDKRKSDIPKEKSDKGKSDTKKHREKNKDEEKTTKEKLERDTVDLEKSKEKDQEKLNEKADKENTHKEKEKSRDKGKSSKGSSSRDIESKKVKDTDRDRSKSSSSKHKSGSSSKKDSNKSSSSSSKDKTKTSEHDKSKSSVDKHSSSKKEGDGKRDSKKQVKDDHYSSKEKKSDRRSTDRDSNDGHSSKNNSTNSFLETASSRMEKNDNELSSSSGQVDSGNSEAVEATSEPVENDESMNIRDNSESFCQSESVVESPSLAPRVPPLKLMKPKIASNFREARKLMKIRKQLAELERLNQLNISPEQGAVNMECMDIENPVQQIEVSSEPVVTIDTLKPFKLNKPKFASNFQEARKLMKIRKQLAKLERQNHQNMTAKLVLEVPSCTTAGNSENTDTADSAPVQKQPLKLNKPKYASNFREATKLMKIRKRLARLEQENKLGLTEASGSTENGKCPVSQNRTATTILNENNWEISTAEVKIDNEISNEPLKSTELSQANWEALEARLAQEMSNVNYNCYDESYDCDDSESSAINISPKSGIEIGSGNVEIAPVSEDSQNDSLEFKGFELENKEKKPTDFLKIHFGKDGREMNNHFKELSVMLDLNGINNVNENLDGSETQYHIEECRYLDQQSPNNLRNLLYILKYIDKLEKEIEVCKTELQNNAHHGRQRKRKFEECFDLKNNNKAYFEQSTVKKRGRPPGSNSTMAKAVKMCNTSDILPNNSFPLPLSPAESDKSNDKKEEEIVVPAKRRRIAIRASQRYSSEDLYKPRLVICRRSRGAKNTD